MNIEKLKELTKIDWKPLSAGSYYGISNISESVRFEIHPYGDNLNLKLVVCESQNPSKWRYCPDRLLFDELVAEVLRCEAIHEVEKEAGRL
jgi:hypothetical protein